MGSTFHTHVLLFAAKFFVGNMMCARSLPELKKLKINRVVFCQSSGEGKMWFKKDPSFEYLPFEIGKFHNFRASTSAARALAFFRKYFEWVDSQLSSGHNVLVHCLAGAHRAGTAGIAYLM